MYRRSFHKAQPVGAEPLPDTSLEFFGALPDFPDLKKAAEFYDREGGDLEVALRAILPGGVYDALLRHMLLGRASLLRIGINA